MLIFSTVAPNIPGVRLPSESPDHASRARANRKPVAEAAGGHLATSATEHRKAIRQSQRPGKQIKPLAASAERQILGIGGRWTSDGVIPAPRSLSARHFGGGPSPFTPTTLAVPQTSSDVARSGLESEGDRPVAVEGGQRRKRRICHDHRWAWLSAALGPARRCAADDRGEMLRQRWLRSSMSVRASVSAYPAWPLRRR